MKPIETIKVLVASVIAVVVMVGIARFSYTPMIPEMVAALGLSKSVVGMLATVNYAGYLTGAVLITRISDLGLKVRLYQLGLVVAVVSTVLMGYTTNVWVWSILRFISGLSTSAGMLLGAGLLMSWLIKNNQKSELGVFFSGIGLGIVLTAVVAELIKDPFTWDQQWVIYGLVALGLLLPAWRWMPDYRACALPKTGAAKAGDERSRFIRILQLAYFCAGVGYVISATFIVAILESMPALSGKGDWIWVVLGLAAIPSCIVWDKISSTIGEVKALMLSYSVLLISILIPALSDTLFSNLLGALLFGATFAGVVSLMLVFIGHKFPANPAKAMAKLTISYGIAQIAAPAILQKRRGRRIDPVHAVIAKPSRSAEHDDIAAIQFQRDCTAGPRRLADAEQACVAQRDRQNRRVEIFLVPVLMQAHLRSVAIEIDQTGLRRMRIAAEVVPQFQQHVRYRRPRVPDHGMRRLVTVAAILVRDPSERPAIRHAHAHFLARARHPGREQRCCGNDRANILDERALRVGGKTMGNVADALG